MKLTTSFIYPPVPFRSHDWCAYDADDEDGPTGYGETEAAALRDFIENGLEHYETLAYAEGRKDQHQEHQNERLSVDLSESAPWRQAIWNEIESWSEAPAGEAAQYAANRLDRLLTSIAASGLSATARSDEPTAFERAARAMNETGQGEHGWAKGEHGWAHRNMES